MSTSIESVENGLAPETNNRRDRLAIGFCLVFPTIVTLAYFVLLADRAETLKVAFGVGKVLQFGFPAVYAFFFAKSRMGWPKSSAKGIQLGLVFGLVISVTMLALYYFGFKPAGLFDNASTAIRTKVAGFGVTSVAAYAALGIFYSVAHSLLEEYYWRWFVHGQLRQSVGRWVSIFVSSIGFMAHHVIVVGIFFGWTNWLTYFLSLGVAVGGAVWAWLYEETDSLIGPWLSHAIIDAAIFLVGYDIVRESLTGA